MKNGNLFFILIISFCIIAGVALLFLPMKPEAKETMVITMPQSDYIRNIDTNYYKEWLEAKTGLNLVFNIVPQSYNTEYLSKVFSSGNIQSDVFFSFSNHDGEFFTSERLQSFGQDGLILPLNQYITSSKYLKAILSDFSLYDLEQYLTAEDGNIYYMPNLDIAATSRIAQVFWLNSDWLKKLNLTIPQTIEDLYKVLVAFQQQDPNGNGIQDEIPLIGSTDKWSSQSYNYIINSFVYNDPENARLFLQNGKMVFAPATKEWRQAMMYLNKLYQQKLLPELQMELNATRLSELTNDPKDLVGAFTSASITDVIHPNCPDILNKFIHVAPVSGPADKALSPIKTPIPEVGGIISATCENPEKAFLLLDLMLSEEAFLMAWYGEENVDWEYAKNTDIDIYGRKATIKVINQLKETRQNKNFAQMGPLYTYTKYADAVTWRGFDAEYINARAYLTYKLYQPREYVDHLNMHSQGYPQFQSVKDQIEDFTETSLKEFITGVRNPNDDSDWNDYLQQLNDLGLDSFINHIQKGYDQAP